MKQDSTKQPIKTKKPVEDDKSLEDKGTLPGDPRDGVVEKVVGVNLEKRIPLTKRQLRFIENWLVPTSDTYANAYSSAVAAGFSKSYARIITADALGLEWVQEAKKRLAAYEPEHIYRAFQNIAGDERVQARDKLKALELMGKARGMFVDRVQNDVKVTFVNDVPRPETERTIIDLETPHGD